MRIHTLILLASIFVFANPANAEQKQQLGDWHVHYMVVGSTFLTPQIAKSYGIVRSKYNALVNISVLDKTTQKAQRVAIGGNATNLLGNSKPLRFKQVQEGEAIYYLAVMSFRHEEQYRFEIEINHGDSTELLRFSQKMYAD